MRLCLLLFKKTAVLGWTGVLLITLIFPGMSWSASVDGAVALYDAKRFPEARVALEKLLAVEPNNAAACYYLGMTLVKRGDQDLLADGLRWLEKASTLEPANSKYLADYGGISLLYAGRTRSLSAATKGRDAMEKAIKLDPNNLDAREGLMRFYQEAPWPIGSSSKAQLQINEIRQRDPERGTTLLIVGKVMAKDYAGAFKLCDELLAKDPNNYAALYQYGRTAVTSGQNLVRGLDCLQKCLTLTPTSPAQPTHANAWVRIGNLQSALSRPAAARAAYESALKLEPENSQAIAALAALK